MNSLVPRADRWTLSFLHGLMALITPLLLFWLAGCEGPATGPQNVEYGPENAATDLNKAMFGLFQGTRPDLTAIGAYVHFATTDDISAGAVNVLVGDTEQTITNRVETADMITYDVLETKVTYHQADSSNQTLTRGFTINFPTSDTLSAASTPTDVAMLIAASVGERARYRPYGTSPTPTPGPDPVTDPTPVPVKVTFHHLRAWTDTGAPPAAVSARANCSGLPGCTMNLRHVSFDIVLWNDASGDRTHFEYTTSPDIPQTIGYQMSPSQIYIPGLVKSCVTQMIPMQDGQVTTKTLISECQEVQDFLFQTTP